MRCFVRVAICTACLVAAATPAAAQATLELTIEEAISRAVAQAPRLAEARSREAAAQAIVNARGAARTPTLTATGGYLRTNHVEEFGFVQPSGNKEVIFPDVPNNYRGRGEMIVPIYTAGRVDAAVTQAQADAQATASDRDATESDVRLEAARAYWALGSGRANVVVLEQSLQRMDAWIGDVRARLAAGFLGPNDLLSAQAQRARQNVQLIQAKNGVAVAELDLARLIGAAPGQQILTTTPVDQPRPTATELSAQPIEALLARARDNRPDRASLVSRQLSLRASADLAQAGTRPQVAGVAAVELSRPNPRFVPRIDLLKTSWDLGVNVNWSLWDGGRARADRAAAMAQSEAVGHRLEEFDAQVAMEVRQRVLDLNSTHAALDATAEYVTAAAEARRVAGERFNAGVATSTEVLDAQIALLQAELERTQIAAALRLEEARLLRSVGGQ